MKNEPEKQANKSAPEEKILLEWKTHMFKKERTYRGVLAAVAVIGCVFLGFQVMDSAIIAAIYGLIFFFALAEFFFPVKYRITDKGAYAFAWTGPRFIEWKKVKKAYKNDKGIKLSVFKHPSPWESFRGMFIRFGDNADECISTVKAIIKSDTVGPA